MDVWELGPQRLLDHLIAYEAGELDYQSTVLLFSELIRSGLAWSLQGAYGRTAQGLIDCGVIDSKGTVDHELLGELS